MSAAKPERKSMKGMGADAFFGTQVNEEVIQDTSKTVNLSTGTEVQQDTALPEYQWDSEEVKNDTSIEGYQQDTTQIKKLTGKTGKKSTNKPANQPAAKELMKASYYVSIEDDLKLEHIRLSRRERGIRVDKSALVREAIAKLKE